jgi:hypothetical protein
MPTYFVCRSEHENGDHVVHVDGCSSIDDSSDMIDIGMHDTCEAALREAKQLFDQCNGCFDCCRTIHAHSW